MVRFEGRKKAEVCGICLKWGHSCTNGISKNKQNDEIIPNSKIYKVFDKMIIEKMDESHYTIDCGRI